MKKHLVYRLPDSVIADLPSIGRIDQNIYLILSKQLESIMTDLGIEADLAQADISAKNNKTKLVKITAVSIKEFNQLISMVDFAYIKSS